LAFFAFWACAKKEPLITIKVDPDFFKTHATRPNILGFAYFQTTLDGKTIVLTADRKKNLDIASSKDYPGLDSLEIKKTDVISDGNVVYYIERLIYMK
jgi:hypothetical protein